MSSARKAVIFRKASTDEGTFGRLILDNGKQWYTGELPWRDNVKGLSSIPSGQYQVAWMNSPTHGMCYHITGVKNRSEIEIHSANYCGDTVMLKKCDLRGCVALGKSVGMLNGQRAVLQSKAAIAEFHEEMNGQPFTLIVHNAPESSVDVEGNTL